MIAFCRHAATFSLECLCPVCVQKVSLRSDTKIVILQLLGLPVDILELEARLPLFIHGLIGAPGVHDSRRLKILLEETGCLGRDDGVLVMAVLWRSAQVGSRAARFL